jgi:hypothetical protein
VRLAQGFISAFVLGCLATPTSASADAQSTIDGMLSHWSEPKGLDTIRHLANCTAKRFPASSQNFIRVVGDETYILSNKNTLMNNKCFKTYWFKNSVTTAVSYIYAPLLAENLLVQNYDVSNIPDLGQVDELDHPALPLVDIDDVHPRYRDMFVVDKITDDLERITECVARAHPQDVFRLAETVPESADESSRLNALQPAITNCGGAKLTVTVPSFLWRGALVKNLYRLVDAARPVTHSEVTPNA